MKKTNPAKIMARAWEISRISAAKFGGRASEYIDEALRISWKMARLEVLENELFILNMKDVSGGRTNAAAQAQISANRRAIAETERRVDALKMEIYPTVTVAEENPAVARLRGCIERNEKVLANVKKDSDRQTIEKMNADMRAQIGRLEKERTVRQWIDTDAYTAA